MKKLSLLLISVVLITACTRKPKFLSPELTAKPPKVVLVLPPENQTSNTNVEEVAYPILMTALAQRGYYVIAPELARNIFNKNKLEDAGRINTLPVQKFKEIFNADAVLKVKVTEWSSKYILISSTVNVGLELELFDTQSGEPLWMDEFLLSASPGNNDSGILAALINNAIHAASVPYDPIALQNATIQYQTIPEGPHYGKWPEK